MAERAVTILALVACLSTAATAVPTEERRGLSPDGKDHAGPGVALPPTNSPCRTLYGLVGGAAMLGVSAALYRYAYPEHFASTAYDIQSEFNGKRYLGLGIFYDREGVYAALDAEDKEILSRASLQPVAAALMLTRKLGGDVEKSLEGAPRPYFPKARNASEYLAGRSARRGVCRHKALVLAGVLEAEGVDVRLQYGYRNGVPHAWVLLERSGMVADAIDGTVEPGLSYFRRTGSRPEVTRKVSELPVSDLAGY